jgi:hypothetical protein
MSIGKVLYKFLFETVALLPRFDIMGAVWWQASAYDESLPSRNRNAFLSLTPVRTI